MIPDENSPPDYTGLHWLSCQLHITIWLEWIWNFEPVYTGYHANSHEIISLEKWNGQNGQNGIWSTWNFRVQAKA